MRISMMDLRNLRVIGGDDVHDVSAACLRKRAWWEQQSTTKQHS
jgi:hypothetical protein